MTRLRKIIEQEKERESWIGVDFDGTLAYYTEFKGHTILGDPIPAMIEKVKALIKQGKKFKIFTARAEFLEEIEAIREWCEKAGIGSPEITNVKDWALIAIWDDKARHVKQNTGMFDDEVEEGVSPAEIDLVKGSLTGN